MVCQEAYTKFKPKEFADSKVLYMEGASPNGLISQTKVTTLNDLKGLKIRSTGISAKVVAKMGGAAVAMPMNEVYDALRKRVIEATIGPTNILISVKLGEASKYYIAWQMLTSAFYTVMNWETWNSLPKDVQDIMDEIGPKYAMMEANAWDQQDIDGWNFGQQKAMELIRWTPEEMKKLRAAVQPLIEEWIQRMESQGLPGREFYKEVVRLNEKYSAQWPEMFLK
jgi:TRAP-type C4-dicarboxylate transport system substrate-binding protein